MRAHSNVIFVSISSIFKTYFKTYYLAQFEAKGSAYPDMCSRIVQFHGNIIKSTSEMKSDTLVEAFSLMSCFWLLFSAIFRVA